MTTRTQQTNSRRWLFPFLAALIAALAAILPGPTASAAATPGAENRVRAISVADQTLVGPPEHITAGQRLGNNAAEPETVVATGVAANSGLYRKVANTGSFAGLTERMSLRNVRNVAREARIGLDGVRVKIVRDPNLIGRGYYGHTPSANTITLYPDAFSSRTALRQTLGHERTHIYQWRTFGKPSDNATLQEFEDAAYGLDYQW